ncbi:hypothetical protein OIDMADRAFT_16986 [Oidiodendron maius Zn]|uniref:Uncharacterized protein n=1 Tax=Oidiodendron maius (strain Zn) TaxID=913774 RepID=A0A0C3D3C2_OIDMZ|nr:hypothetical protein OIDMADRAFT_16986 [Oidiodendron maius Zn]
MHGLAFSLPGAKFLISHIYGNYNYALVTDMACRGRANTLGYHLHPQPLVAQKQPAVYLPIMLSQQQAVLHGYCGAACIIFGQVYA